LEPLAKLLILAGCFLALLGLLLLFWDRIPLLGKLPGDISFAKGNDRFFFPIVTSLVVSLILTVVLNVLFGILRK
jgi:hypothetical protein